MATVSVAFPAAAATASFSLTLAPPVDDDDDDGEGGGRTAGDKFASTSGARSSHSPELPHAESNDAR